MVPYRLAGGWVLAAIVAAGASTPAVAQLDYRNLDAGHPVHTEDAYAIERYAFEFTLPYEYIDEVGSSAAHAVIPELSYGLLPNVHLGVGAPFAVAQTGAGRVWASAGIHPFALYNFNTESPALPAFSLRGDATIPVGKLAASDARFAITGIATRSFGRTRVHTSATAGLGPETGIGPIDPLPTWAAGIAVDRTFLRESWLLIGELTAEQVGEAAPHEVTVAVGARWQLTPTIVVNGGARRRLTRDAGPNLGLTFGLSHVFALPIFFPGRAR